MGNNKMTALARAAVLTNYLEVARHLGLNGQSLLSQAGLSVSQLDDPNKRIPVAAAVSLLEESARVSGCETFGLRMAELRQLSDFGEISLLLSHQRTLRDALQVIVQYRHLLNESLAIHIEEAGKTVIIREEVVTDRPAHSRQAIELAVACENAARNHHADISNSEGASLNTFEGLRVMGNSLGFLHGYASSRHSLSVSVIGERDQQMQRDDWWTVARDARDLQSPEEVGRIAAERTIRRLGARSLSTRQCPVIFASDVAASLLGHFIGAIRGGNLYRKSSFLLDQLGKPVFPDFVQIHEQPHLKKALGSVPYDAEGVRTVPHHLVRNGILESYVLSTYSARKLGMTSTGNAGGVHNLIIDPGTLDQAGLLQKMGTGLLVTELMGQGVNLVTGDYSRGAAGFWVENGTIQYPVEEFTIAGNLRDMLKTLVAVGNDVDLRGNTRTGSIMLEQLTIAGN
jgi:PmbA protein